MGRCGRPSRVRRGAGKEEEEEVETCFLGGSDSGGARRTEGCKFLAHPPTSAASGRPMVLTVEGNPTDSLITNGGYGNAKRVGHDISPNWVGAGDPPDISSMTCPPPHPPPQLSMVSLVDIGSNLWPFAHNSTNATYGGWWNGGSV